MEISKGKQIHQGRILRVCQTKDPERLLLVFRDDKPGAKTGDGRIKNRGRINNAISSALFKYLESFHVPTHFIDCPKPNEMLVWALSMLPVQVKIWNYSSGSLCKRFGLEKEAPLDCPVVEYYLKNPSLKFPMISLDHISAFRLASSEALLLLEKMARKINAVLKSYFERREIVLADLELEFGMRQDQLLLGDALTPDTCQLWDFRGSQKPNSKSFQVDDTGDAGAAYEALYQRIVG